MAVIIIFASEPTVLVLISKVLEVAPAATVTFVGIDIKGSVESVLDDNCIVKPPEGAELLKVTIPIEGAPLTTESGDKAKLEITGFRLVAGMQQVAETEVQHVNKRKNPHLEQLCEDLQLIVLCPIVPEGQDCEASTQEPVHDGFTGEGICFSGAFSGDLFSFGVSDGAVVSLGEYVTVPISRGAGGTKVPRAAEGSAG